MNRRLKRVVIKEELVELTGDFTKAVILNQFIYWSERVRDFDSFIKEEKKRLSKNQEESKIEKQHGWFYKNADELSEEVMLGVTSKTMRKHIAFLVDNGWVDQRNNPKYKWDRTLQYRVNIYKVQKDLYKIGYSLEGYSLKFEEAAMLRNENKSKMEAEEVCVRSGRKSSAIPEITTETTTENVVNKPNAFTVFEQSGFGLLSGTIIDNINNWIDDFKDKGSTEQEADELVSLALRKADENGVRKWNYAHKILLNWFNKGFTKPSDVEAHEKQREQKQGSQQSKKDSPDFSWEDELDNL